MEIVGALLASLFVAGVAYMIYDQIGDRAVSKIKEKFRGYFG